MKIKKRENLWTHRSELNYSHFIGRAMVLMKKPSVIDAPSGGAPEQAPRWDLVDTESCSGGIRVLAPVLIVWGYVCIYRRKEYVGGAPRGPRGRGAP